LIKANLGTTWVQRPLWVKTGYRRYMIYETTEERGCAMWQHRDGPSQRACATWHTSIGPPQHLWAPPVCHVAVGDKATSAGHATWQYTRQHTSADQSLRN
jgi:hypothetical protein